MIEEIFFAYNAGLAAGMVLGILCGYGLFDARQIEKAHNWHELWIGYFSKKFKLNEIEDWRKE